MEIFNKPIIWLAGLITRWLFKVLSGVFLAFGITENSVESYLISTLTFIAGIVITYIQNKYLKNLEPNK